ncbi:MAG: hypothetical protein IT461_11735 [Planctomycetes bacterium]|jgi:hypothetical protein|nr:hypothetical protein [Planctomycetota bacterium]
MHKTAIILLLGICFASTAHAQQIGQDAPDKAFLSARHLPAEVTRLSHLRRAEPRVVLLDWFGVS